MDLGAVHDLCAGPVVRRGRLPGALVRGDGRDLAILSDLNGVRAAFSEQSARRTGHAYELEPVQVERGVFNGKVR